MAVREFDPQIDRVLGEQEMLDALVMAVILHYAKLPQLKGAGALRDQDKRMSGLKFFARALKDQLLLSDTRLIIGPGSGGHS